MSFSFPPAPPGYDRVVIARLLLAAWGIVGTGIIVHRLRNWKHLQSTQEGLGWVAAYFVCFCLSYLGICRETGYDDNFWLALTEVTAILVCFTGTIVCWWKVQREGTYAQKGVWALGWGCFIIASVLYLCPSLSHSAEDRYRTQCKHNLKLIGMAVYNYESTYGSYPASAAGKPPVSWRVAILPYVDNFVLYQVYNQSLSWNDPSNLMIAQRIVNGYMCYSNWQQKDQSGNIYTAYSMLTGPRSVGANPNGTKVSAITDGTSQTLFAVEACGAQIIWTEPRDVDVSAQSAGVNLSGQSSGHSSGWASSYHQRGTHILFADGMVRFISTNTDPALLKRLATIDGNENVIDFTGR